MSHTPAFTTILTCLVLGAACAHRPGATTPADPGERDRLEERQDDFLAALSARDLEGVTAHFAPDALLHVANMPPVRGSDAIRRFYGNVFRFIQASDPAPETIRIAASGDMAYSTGSVTNRFEGQTGPVEYAGKYLLVWDRRDGDWLIAVYSVSGNQPDPGR